MTVEAGNWGKCNICKKPIAFGATYLKCVVSTCNRKSFQLYFCSESCWDAHNPDFGPFFGRIFTSGEPRRMQFALRYDF